MPYKLATPCSKAGCPELSHKRYCPEHEKQTRAEYDRDRGSSGQRGYDWTWQKNRKAYIRKHPLCVHCKAEGRVTAAQEIDHIIPLKRGGSNKWDNLQSLCKVHHSQKTRKDLECGS